MEKSVRHWRAEHPLLFVSFYLITGALLLPLLGIQPISVSTALLLQMISLLCLMAIIHYSIPATIKNTCIRLILIIWGLAIFGATQNTDLLDIPYSDHWIQNIRNGIIHKINDTIKSPEANGFAQALLLGVRTEMDEQLFRSYQQLGLIHIIAISGMHLEIIFKNVTRLTQWLPRNTYVQFIEVVFVLAFIWTYTLVAFASPSIVRASVFFTIYFIGKHAHQQIFFLNLVATGLMTILLFNIRGLGNIGLQLSYAAVLGIHLLYPLFKKAVPMDNPLLSFLWNNFSVSLAAQLTTLPIIVYHFHEMSTMVLISNFIMVPISNLLLYALAFLLLLPNYFSFGLLLGETIGHYIIKMNHVVVQIAQQFPYMAVIHLPGYLLFGYYLLLILLYLWIKQKKAKYLQFALWWASLLFLIKLFSPF